MESTEHELKSNYLATYRVYAIMAILGIVAFWIGYILKRALLTWATGRFALTSSFNYGPYYGDDIMSDDTMGLACLLAPVLSSVVSVVMAFGIDRYFPSPLKTPAYVMPLITAFVYGLSPFTGSLLYLIAP